MFVNGEHAHRDAECCQQDAVTITCRCFFLIASMKAGTVLPKVGEVLGNIHMNLGMAGLSLLSLWCMRQPVLECILVFAVLCSLGAGLFSAGKAFPLREALHSTCE